MVKGFRERGDERRQVQEGRKKELTAAQDPTEIAKAVPQLRQSRETSNLEEGGEGSPSAETVAEHTKGPGCTCITRRHQSEGSYEVEGRKEDTIGKA